MRFRMLGSLEIRQGERWVPLRPRKQGVVLATLLCHRNEAVSADHLVDAVWGAEPPRTARENLQVYVYHLRRALGGKERIARRDDGYLLRVTPEEVDADLFERLVSQARRLATAGGTGEPARLYHEALALWRGPVLGDFADAPAVQVEASRLQERRLTALEERIELDLALGRHSELIAEQSRLVAEYPLRERFRAQLMVALFRRGRQAEALAAYHDGRRILTEELGLDPGPHLQGLYQAILRGSLPDSYQEVAEGHRPDPPYAPAQLPAVVADFAGRERELADIRRFLAPDLAGTPVAMPIVAISGMAGIGKTTLAVHAGQTLRAGYPDGQLHLRLRADDGGAVDPATALDRALRALGVPAATALDALDERVHLYRSRLAGRRVLVLLDDAAGEWQVRPLLPGSPTCAVLVTSRTRLVGLEGALAVQLDVLDPDEALLLLSRAAGTQRVAAEVAAARDIVRFCTGLPLAVRAAAARLVARPGWSLRRFGDLLADETRRLNLLTAGDLAVRASVARSYRELNPDDRRVLRLLALLDPAGFSAATAAATLDLPPDEAMSRLETLVDAQLLVASGIDDTGAFRYRLHDLVRVFAWESCQREESPVERWNAVARVVARMVDTALAEVEQTSGGAARRWLLGVVGWAGGTPIDRAGWRDAGRFLHLAELAHAPVDQDSGWPWQRRIAAGLLPAHHLDELRTVHRAALAAARTTGDRLREAAVCYGLAAVEIAGRHIEPAAVHVTRAVKIFESLGEKSAARCGHRVAAFLDRAAGRLDRAREQYLLASTESRRAGDLHAEAAALRGLAEAAERLGDAWAARAALDRLTDICRQTGDRRQLLDALLAQGGLLLGAGRAAEAETAFTRSLELVRTDRRDVDEAYAHYGLGEAHARQGRPGPALACWHEALRLTRESGQRRLRGRTLLSIAQLYLDSGLEARAVGPAAQALATLQELGDQFWQRRALAVLADAHAAAERAPAGRPAAADPPPSPHRDAQLLQPVVRHPLRIPQFVPVHPDPVVGEHPVQAPQR